MLCLKINTAGTWPQYCGAIGMVISMRPGFCLPKTRQLVYIDELVISSNVYKQFCRVFYLYLNSEKTEA